MKFVKYSMCTETGELLAEFILQENIQFNDFIFENRDNFFCFVLYFFNEII
jgi:hypothetical protein